MQVDLRHWITVTQKPRRRQAGPGKNPAKQAKPIEFRGLCNNLQTPRKTPRLGRYRSRRVGEIRIGEDVGEIKPTLTHNMLGINRQPAARAEVQHIVVVQITVQNDDLALIAQ